MEDVVVVGGGAIGLSIALELAGQGVAVAVLDQADFGREASWAGAGILPPGRLAGAQTPEAMLRGLSHALWPGWSELLQAETGIDIGFRRCGGLEVRVEGIGTTGRQFDDLSDERVAWQEEGVAVENLQPARLAAIEPALSAEIDNAYRLPELAQVRNPRLVKALVAACAGRGVRLAPGTPVAGFEERDGRIVAAKSAEGRIAAGRFCVAGGAWSRMIVASMGIDVAIGPVRGQMVLLSDARQLISHVVQAGRRYLVPRDDGRLLIGSTEEHVGFLKANSASAVSELIAFGCRIVPALADSRFERAWSGLRPGSGDGLPFLGRVNAYDNLFVASGHFRSGLQMSPGTARVLRQSLMDQETDIPLESFAIDRQTDAVPANE